jgi:Ca2+-binding EF-hand superfamily protein
MNQGRPITSDERKIVLVICLMTALVAFGTNAGAPAAQKVDKSITKRTLALKSGKISKKEFMDFMEAEFDRLDKNKSGELDVKELIQSRARASRPAIGK